MLLESSNSVDGTEEACPVRTGKPEHVLIDGRFDPALSAQFPK